MTVHISLDLETWGTRAGCDIRSIGAVVFYPSCGHVANPRNGGDDFGNSFYRSVENPMIGFRKDVPKYPLWRDPATVKWWNEQSAEAQGAFTSPVDLARGLNDFAAWLSARTKRDTELRIWTHGAAFDLPILEAAYHAVGLGAPWHYRSPRDTRTIFELAGMDPHKCLNDFTTPGETYHHALDDAIVQARAICHAYGLLSER